MWRTFAEGAVTLSEAGALATQTGGNFTLTTTGTDLTEGKHYWVHATKGGTRPHVQRGQTSSRREPRGRTNTVLLLHFQQ
jgi:hypothetical protein